MSVFNYKQFTIDVVSKKFDIMRDQKRTIGLREFAKDIGISAPTLSRICNGGKADLDTAILISRWLGKDLGEYILNGAT